MTDPPAAPEHQLRAALIALDVVQHTTTGGVRRFALDIPAPTTAPPHGKRGRPTRRSQQSGRRHTITTHITPRSRATS